MKIRSLVCIKPDCLAYIISLVIKKTPQEANQAKNKISCLNHDIQTDKVTNNITMAIDTNGKYSKNTSLTTSLEQSTCVKDHSVAMSHVRIC
jgi:hypothetical protein